MKEKLLVFVNSRMLREYMKKNYSNLAFLPKMMTISEFENRVQIVKNKTRADEDSKIILLKKASEFKDFKLLKIEREYLEFVKSAGDVLKFFEELAIEKIDLLVEFDKDGNIIDCNELFRQFLNLDKNKILEFSLTNLMDSKSIIYNELMESIGNGQIYTFSYFIFMEGEKKYFNASFAPVIDANQELVKIVAIGTDVTELMKYRQNCQ